MKKFFRVLLNILGWTGVGFFAIMSMYALSQKGYIGALLLVLAGALLIPLECVRALKKRIKFNAIMSAVLAVVLLFVGVMITPAAPTNSEATFGDELSTSELPDASDITDEITQEADATEIADETGEDTTTVSETKETEETTPSVPVTPAVPDTTTAETTAPAPKAPASGVGSGSASPVNPASLPAYSGTAYTVVNNNQPNFSASELSTTGYEKYSPLDGRGRCGPALASCGKEIMPKAGEERGSISSIKPTGWVQAKYSGVSGGYLWNRCHLIGWQLSAENANRQNLITGTRYMNINGMLTFENMVADYIKETDNHVAYRITPIFEGNNLVCSGVQMEAYSIEDDGDGICFNVYCYNVQPGITIDYATGNSTGPSADTTTSAPVTQAPETTTSGNNDNVSEMVWIPNSGSKYHTYAGCSNMKNPRQVTEDEAEAMGYEPCKKCH